MNETKLKNKELKEYRDEALKRQYYKCKLCGGALTRTHANLDHDHSTGRVRHAVHPECNILLGKIENFLNRYPRGLENRERLAYFLDSALSYMDSCYDNHPFHPKHLTEDDKTARHYRRMIKKSKKAETKLKWRTKLKELGYER